MTGHCAIRLTRRYAASQSEVWDALVEPASVRRWLGDIDARLRPIEDGRVLEIDLGDSVARVELTSDGERTVVVLAHDRISAALGMRFVQRWTAAFDRFDREVEA